MSILKSTTSGANSNKVTKTSLLEHGFYYLKIKTEYGRKIKDLNHIVINKYHNFKVTPISEDVHFYLETKENQFWFKVENILDLQLVLRYCSDEKKYRYLRLQMMNDERTYKQKRYFYGPQIKEII